jgi:hypothetical protein
MPSTIRSPAKTAISVHTALNASIAAAPEIRNMGGSGLAGSGSASTPNAQPMPPPAATPTSVSARHNSAVLRRLRRIAAMKSVRVRPTGRGCGRGAGACGAGGA